MCALLRIVGWLVVVVLPSAGLLAQPVPSVPPALAPWRDWVLYGEEFRACPVRNGASPGQEANHVCAWPGTLALDVAAATAKFDQTWDVYAETWVPLPGNAELWPTDVTVEGTRAPVVLHDNRPSVQLKRGMHRLAGAFAWSTRPASIPVPAETGFVSLKLDGTSVPNAQLEGGTLWLGLRPEAEAEEDRLDVVVHRKLTDSLPAELETQISLDVAGQSREVTLDGATLPGFVAESLDADLPAQLTPAGQLRIQVRPGQWELDLVAHGPSPAVALARPAAVAPWPDDEIWSFAPESRLRVAALEGAEPVDPERTGVPSDWRSLSSYRVAAGQTVNVAERSRNDAAQANRLRLNRDLWLDFDGGGFTARDRVTGQMSSGWRLDMAAPYVMTMATVGGDNLLVTEGAAPGLQGVELRAADVDLTATARLARAGAVPVTGYRETFDDVSTTLHAPPGYRLVAAPGSDRAGGAWLERWRLLDVFLVLIVAVAAWRLFGSLAGIVALVALVVAFHEPGAPRWAWLSLIVAAALLRVAPVGRLKTFAAGYRWVSLGVLALLLTPFTITQLRLALHPQLELPILGRSLAPKPALAGRALERIAPASASVSRAPQQAVEQIVVTATRSIGGELSRYLPGALVQTGPGLPDWTWTQYRLTFAGPVPEQQSVRLVLFGPPVVSLWRIASVVLTLGLLWLLAGRPRRLPAGLVRGSAAAALIGVAALLAPPQPAAAQAANDFPSAALLDELKARLTKPAPCYPSCAEAQSAHVDVRANELAVDLTYALAAPAAVPLPGVPKVWRPAEIAADGTSSRFVLRDAAEVVWLSLPAGVHRVTVRGPLPALDGLGLAFPLKPRHIDVAAPGWDAAGIIDGRLPSGTLELTRQRAAAAGGEIGGTVFPPFVSVVRRITFDIDWRVRTTVTRVAPDSGAFTLPIDLIANEAVLTPGVEVSGGRATVAFAAGEDEVDWESRLPTAQTLSLTAPAAAAAWSESWQFAVGRIWHADYSGVPATAPESPDPALYVPEYHPRPGETLTVALRRPEPASGDTIAFDAVDYTRNVGARASQSTLTLKYRSTRAMDRRIALPMGSNLESVAIDNTAVPLKLDGNVLALPVTPGKHDVQLVWRETGGPAVATGVPPVDLGGGASNVTTTLHVPETRWALFAFGPRVGPAVLYWPELLAFALIAFAVGRLALSPLRTYEWLLLGWGLSTFAWPVLALFAVWAFAMSARERMNPQLSDNRFNAMQAGLALLTVAALGALLGAIPWGLLGQPDMQIVSPVSYDRLSWFADRIAATTPNAGVISVSIWFYKAAMLAWALWLSFRLLRWLPWAWRAFSSGGLWRRRVRSPT
jgi:hypothetical protein